MIGTIHNTKNGWVVRPKLNDDRLRVIQSYGDKVDEYPLILDDVKKYCQGVVFFADDTEVEFDLVSVYIEPPDSIHCNRGYDVFYAKINDDNEIWNNILAEFLNEEHHHSDTGITINEWLIKNFHPPKRK